jgi:hypothetical protein
MHLNTPHRACIALVLLALGLPVCLGGCPHRVPPAPADESWYRKDRLFDAFDADAAGLSLGNAYLLELACYIGDRGTFEVDRTLATWGFGQRRDFRDLRTSTYGYVASNDRIVLVTFGGTDFLNVRDLLSDVDALDLVHDETYCERADARVHRGFRDSLNSVIAGVTDEVRRQANAPASGAGGTSQPTTAPRRRLYVAGHSRGGAFAVLAAAAFAKARQADSAANAPLPDLAGVYTFGQPRVGNGPFVESLTSGARPVPLYRFVNRDDPVPQVPPESATGVFGYKHAGNAIYLQPDGKLGTQAPGQAYPDPRTASLSSHYQPAYQAGIYAAIANPQLIEDPSLRTAAPPAGAQAFPAPPR